MSNGFVPFPNEILDQVMPELSANGWKVFCFVWRKTRGWKKTSDEISISQIMDGTGIGSNNTVNKAIDEIAKIITVERGRGRSKAHKFDTKTLNIKDAECEPLPVKDAETASIKPLKHAVFDVKDAETASIKPLKHAVFDVKHAETAHTTDINTTNNKKIKREGAKKPAAVHVYRSAAHLYPHKSLWAKMDEIVGDSEKKLILFKKVIEGWIGAGYNPKNVNGILDRFKSGDIPGTKKQRTKSNGHSKQLKQSDVEEKRLHAENVKRVLAERKQASSL